MNLEDELKNLFVIGVYKGKTLAEIERLAGLGNGTIAYCIKANNMSVRTLNKLAAVVGRTTRLIFRKIPKGES
tara:strand:- start:956 stop:1174 length:219 start_codon:yes stop_codon:yes gene_type:complete